MDFLTDAGTAAAAIVALGAAMTITLKALKWIHRSSQGYLHDEIVEQIAAVRAELQSNGGSSFRDEVMGTLRSQNKALLSMHHRLVKLDVRTLALESIAEEEQRKGNAEQE